LAWAALLASVLLGLFLFEHLLVIVLMVGLEDLGVRGHDLVEHFLEICWFLVTDGDGAWGEALSRLKAPDQAAWIAGSGLTTLLSILMLMLLVRRSASSLLLRWQEEPPSAARQAIQQTFCTPTYGVGLLRSWLRRTLERNPIAWLERRSWSARLVTWIWLALLVSVYSMFFYVPAREWGGFLGFQTVLAGAMLLSLGATTAGSFRREREAGVLELLVISPLSERQIILGRLRGIWAQFLPAFGLWFGVGIFLWGASGYWQKMDTWMDERLITLIVMASTYFTLPVVGLYSSLVRAGYFTALVQTLLCGLVLPAILARALTALLEIRTGGGELGDVLLNWLQWKDEQLQFLLLVGGFVMLQALVARFGAKQMHRRLVTRRFARIGGEV
jgi:hypothetical protein